MGLNRNSQRRRSGAIWPLFASAVLFGFGALAGCHLVLGLETAETIDPATACDTAADCNDNNPCTEDACAGSCVNTPLSGVDAPASQQVAGDCQRVGCFSGAAMTVADDDDLPDDGEQCTTDSCNNGDVVHDALPGGTACSQDGGNVCSAGKCVECHSNTDCVQPATCGGGGTPNECGCTPTQSCVVEGLTCGFIQDMTCGGSIACNNNMQDGNETDVDCGGSVSTCSLRCGNGKMCVAPSDCASNNCVGNVCEP